MIFLQQKYKQKPKQWGPFSAVQSAIFDRLSQLELDYTKINLLTYAWEQTGNKLYDYGPLAAEGAVTNGTWDGQGIRFDGLNGSVEFAPDVRRTFSPSKDNGLSVFWRHTDGIDVLFTPGSATGFIQNIIHLPWSDTVYSEYTWGRPFHYTISLAGGNPFQKYYRMTTGEWAKEKKNAMSYCGAISVSELTSYHYVDGEAKGTNSGSLYSSYGVHSDHPLFLKGYDCFSFAFDVVFIIRDYITPDQQAYLDDNPYCLIQPRSEKTIFLPLDGSILSPINITTDAFVVSFPEIGQKHGLQVAGIEAQSPFVQAPVFGIQAGTDDLISTDLTTPLPLIDSAMLGQKYALGSDPIATSPVVINSPLFNRVLSDVIAQRSFNIAYENREYSVEYKNRAYAIEYENREYAVEYENREYSIEYEKRTLTA